MTFAGMTLRGSDTSSRWLLLGSLALNLFFIGIGGALLMQGYGSAAPARQSWNSRSVTERIERISQRLPGEDAARLKGAFQARRDALESARTIYRERQEAFRSALRREPFELDALKTSLADMRAARQAFDLQFHDFFAQQAAEMSPAGRHKLADWPSRRTEATTQPKK